MSGRHRSSRSLSVRSDSRLRRLSAAVLFALVLGTAALGAADELPSADQIVERYVAARGGAEALRGLRSIEIRGSYTAFSQPGPFLLQRQRPASYRFETEMIGNPYVVGTDGEIAWIETPLYGFSWALTQPPGDAAATRVEAEIEPPLLDYAAKGHRVRLVGLGAFEGTPAYELELVRADGLEETFYLDPESYLEVARVTAGSDFGQAMPRTIVYDDFRRVGALVIPYYREEQFGMRFRMIEIESVELDPPIAAERFVKPLSAGMETLRPLAGRWEVTVERLASPGAGRQSTTRSKIVPQLAGALLSETIELPFAGTQIAFERRWTFDRFAERFRVTEIDELTASLVVFEGAADEEGRIVLSNVETGSAIELQGAPAYRRWTLSEIGEEGFRITVEASGDGETWSEETRLSYRRAPPS